MLCDAGSSSSDSYTLLWHSLLCEGYWAYLEVIIEKRGVAA